MDGKRRNSAETTELAGEEEEEEGIERLQKTQAVCQTVSKADGKRAIERV
jgi:hypothetical protein